jgi:hypothetical protein
MVVSSKSGESRSIYRGPYTLEGYGGGYFFPTWVVA